MAVPKYGPSRAVRLSIRTAQRSKKTNGAVPDRYAFLYKYSPDLQASTKGNMDKSHGKCTTSGIRSGKRVE